MVNVIKPSVVAAAVGLIAVSAPAAALAASYDVPKSLGGTLRRVEARTSVPVLVPTSIDLDYKGRLFASGSAGRNGYTLALDGGKDCQGATACSLSSYTARRGGRFTFKTRLRLHGGVPAAYVGQTCGVSCDPPAIQFRTRGVLYVIAAKVSGTARTQLVAAANSALASGPR